MSKIQIICSKPGIRRNGIEQPAQATYESGHWTEDQIKAFEADPAFIVQEVSDGGTALSGSEFDAVVAAEVKKQVETITAGMQASYNNAVTTAVNEKLADIEVAHDNAMDAIGKKLKAAEDEVAALKAAQKPVQDPATENQQSGTEAAGAGEANADAGKGKPKQ
ncbi:hypothetical protein CFBP6626_17930 [Agrobacterium tumefaciens]|nr:hypothetical protein CFBP6626_17930 [Agrobacterium tumefaciens]CUX60129.1 conserved hypothetical protein [Agrobacterium genomosp. 5 str. CFBP 6626]